MQLIIRWGETSSPLNEQNHTEPIPTEPNVLCGNRPMKRVLRVTVDVYYLLKLLNLIAHTIN